MGLSPLVGRFVEGGTRRSSRLAVVDDYGARRSFGDLLDRSRRVAASLVERRLEGARVALLVEPGASWVEAFFGALLARGTVVPLSPLHPPTEWEWFLAASRSAAVITSPAFRSQLDEIGGSVPRLTVEDLVGRADGVTLEPKPTDVALILYTSGTTGKPKGALLSHEATAAVAGQLAEAWGFTEDDRLVHTLPLHHLHGLGVSLLTTLWAGGCVRMLERFEAARVWEELGDATALMGVPTQHKKLFEAFDSADSETRTRWTRHARGLRLVTSGSAALSPKLGERWVALCDQYPLERYGMTEVGIALTNPLAGERRPGTVGRAVPGMEVRVVDESGRDVTPGQSGEIRIRGRSVFAGYDGNDEATAKAFVDGWFASGDTATVTPEGYVKILGRTSVDILKSGGYKLSALEIEEVLRRHEAIAEVAVVGIPDDTWGDLVVAVVIAREGRDHEIAEERLRTWAKQHLAAYKVPKRVVVCDELPRNALGKVVKPKLADWVAKQLGAGGEEASSP